MKRWLRPGAALVEGEEPRPRASRARGHAGAATARQGRDAHYRSAAGGCQPHLAQRRGRRTENGPHQPRRNLAAHQPAALGRYHELLVRVAWVSAPVPADMDTAPWAAAINPKDRHVVAASLACGANYLLSLDRGLLAEVGRAALPVVALEPGRLIKTVLPLHGDLPDSP